MATKTQAKATSGTRIAPQRVSVLHRKNLVITDNKMTVEDWAAMPDTKPRYELIDGLIFQKMTTTSKHAWTVGELLFALKTWGQPRGWIFFPEGVGIKLGANDGAVADVVGFAPGAQLHEEETYFSQTPFLVVEVVSRSTAKRDRTDKKTGYAKIGVQIYLIADPDKKTLEVHTLKNNKYGAPRVLAVGEIWQPEELVGLQIEVDQLWMK